MRILDYDFDEGEFIFTLSADREELLEIVKTIDSSLLQYVSEYQEEVFKNLHDCFLKCLTAEQR